MQRNRPWLVRCAIFSLTVLAAALPAVAKEGFGLLTKKAASLTRVQPPLVFLMGTKFDIRVQSPDPSGGSVADRLRSQLESELISRDNRLVVERQRPETLFEVTILQNDKNEQWERRQETAVRQVGKDAKGKPVFQSYTVEVNYKVVTHAFGASYRVTDVTRNASLDADSVQHNFKDDFREGKNAPEIFSLESAALSRVVDSIARRVTPTRETIGVLLPKGTLEDLGNLAEAGQWNRYLEALEKRTANAKANDESYRQYALGTAYEALGYAADDPETTLKYLEQASIYYGKALETNPGEKYFSQSYDSVWSNRNVPPPLDRVQTAVTNYRRFKDFRDNYDSLVASKAAESSKSLEREGPGSSSVMNNNAVIEMVKAGLDREIILNAIDLAQSHEFDVSPKGLVTLADAKVDKEIIKRLQDAASGKKPAPKPTPSKKKSGKGR